jgi:hypothetical protein
LNIDVKGGRPIAMRAPAAVSPFNSDLRDVLTRSVIICDMLRKFSWVWNRLTDLLPAGFGAGKLAQHH